MSQFGGTLGALAGMVGMGASSSSRLSRGEAYAALTSTSQVQGFIDEQNLLPVLFSDLWDPEKEEWLVDDPENIPTLSDGYDMFMNELLICGGRPGHRSGYSRGRVEGSGSGRRLGQCSRRESEYAPA